jgi:hypothetical protein
VAIFTTTPAAAAELEALAAAEAGADAAVDSAGVDAAGVDATGAVVGGVVAAGDEQAAASKAIATRTPKPLAARRMDGAGMAFSQVGERAS